MAEQRAKSRPATKEPKLDNHLVHFIRIGSCVEDRVRSKKRAKLRHEELEGSHLIIRSLYQSCVILMPIVSNLGLGQILENFFIRWSIKQLERMGETILVA